MRSLFVAMHESRVASHVGSQYRRQPAFNPNWPLFHHGMQPNPQLTLRRIRRDAYSGSCRLSAHRVISPHLGIWSLLEGGLNRSPQHFILEGKDGVWDGTEIS